MNDDDNEDMNLEQVLAFIYNADHSTLKVINDTLRDAWNNSSAEAATKFRRGEKVKFTPQRDGIERTGTVLKVNRKSVKVRVEKGRFGTPETWSVGPTNLAKA